MESVDWGLLLVRMVVGLLLAGHGAQKLFGWSGGPGTGGFTWFTGSLGLRPAAAWAWIGALSEFGGGFGLALGLLTPLAAAGIIASMLVATATLHWSNGLWAANNGYEFPLTLAAVAAGLGIAGPGLFSLDAALGIAWPAWVFPAAVTVAVAGAVFGLATRALPAAAQAEAERPAA